mgnify:CR=1 FL=1
MPETTYNYKKTLNTITVSNIIGMPPRTYVSDSVMFNSMPIIRISPHLPRTSTGLTLFTLESAQDEYNKILNNLGYSLDAPLEPIRLVFNADTLPVDTFTNDYTETFLQRMTDVASQGMSQIMQIAGAKTFTEGVRKIGEGTAEKGEELGGTVGGFMKTAGETAAEIAKELEMMKGRLGAGAEGDRSLASQAINTIDKMMAGHRIDFPKIWGNSAYAANFSVNVRLFNPRPGNLKYTQQYLIGPLAVILALALPRSDDGYSYQWPFFHKIEAPGFLNLTPAAITNVTVTKGGDAQQLAFSKTLGLIDVRIDFTTIYESMLLESEDSSLSYKRPTVKNYLASLEKNSQTNNLSSRSEMRRDSANAAGANATGGGPVILRSSVDPQTSVENITKESLLAKNFASAKRLSTATDIVKEGPSRVSSSIITVSKNLVNQNKEFIKDNIPSGIAKNIIPI